MTSLKFAVSTTSVATFICSFNVYLAHFFIHRRTLCWKYLKWRLFFLNEDSLLLLRIKRSMRLPSKEFFLQRYLLFIPSSGLFLHEGLMFRAVRF